jgi:thioredoxin-like negative regulator of GroEL
MIHVTCLCAEWCSSCRGYREVFEAAARAADGRARFAWIDIEDHPEVMGETEVETFPTLLIAEDGHVAFFGPVTPHAATLSGLVDRALAHSLGPVRDAAAAGIAVRALEHAER